MADGDQYYVSCEYQLSHVCSVVLTCCRDGWAGVLLDLSDFITTVLILINLD